MSERLRVPAVYLTWANSMFLLFLPFSRISKLSGISEAKNSDSPRLHHSNYWVIYRLRGVWHVHVRLVSNASGRVRLESHSSDLPGTRRARAAIRGIQTSLLAPLTL